MALTLFDDQGVSTLVCSLHSRSAVAWLDPDTLQPYAAGVDEHRVAEAARAAEVVAAVEVQGGRAIALAADVRDAEIHCDYRDEAHRLEAEDRQQVNGMDLGHIARVIVGVLAEAADIEVRSLNVSTPGYVRRPYRS